MSISFYYDGVKIGECCDFGGCSTFNPDDLKEDDDGFIDIEDDIDEVIFSNPATIVKWMDGSKTVVKAQDGEPFDKEKGLAMAIIKYLTGNTGEYNEIFKRYCK